jgi:hypothetical protein
MRNTNVSSEFFDVLRRCYFFYCSFLLVLFLLLVLAAAVAAAFVVFVVVVVVVVVVVAVAAATAPACKTRYVTRAKDREHCDQHSFICPTVCQIFCASIYYHDICMQAKLSPYERDAYVD